MKYLSFLIFIILSTPSTSQERLSDFKSERTTGRKILAPHLDTTYFIELDLANDFKVYRLDSFEHDFLHQNTLGESFHDFSYYVSESNIIFYTYNRLLVYDFLKNEFILDREFDEIGYIILHHRLDDEFVIEIRYASDNKTNIYRLTTHDSKLDFLFETGISRRLSVEGNFISILTENDFNYFFTIYDYVADSTSIFMHNSSTVKQIENALYYFDFDYPTKIISINKYDLYTKETKKAEIPGVSINDDIYINKINNNPIILIKPFLVDSLNYMYLNKDLEQNKFLETSYLGYPSDKTFNKYDEYLVLVFDNSITLFDTLTKTSQSFYFDKIRNVSFAKKRKILITSEKSIDQIDISTGKTETLINSNYYYSSRIEFTNNSNGSFYLHTNNNDDLFLFIDNEDSIYAIKTIDESNEGLFNTFGMLRFDNQIILKENYNLFALEDTKLVKINSESNLYSYQSVDTSFGSFIFAEIEGLLIKVYEYKDRITKLLCEIQRSSNVYQFTKYGDNVIMYGLNGTYIYNIISMKTTFLNDKISTKTLFNEKLYFTDNNYKIWSIDKKGNINSLVHLSKAFSALFIFNNQLYLKDDYIYKLENNDFIKILDIPIELQNGKYFKSIPFKKSTILKTINSNYYHYSFDGNRIDKIAESTNGSIFIKNGFILDSDLQNAKYCISNLSGDKYSFELNKNDEEVILDIISFNNDTLLFVRLGWFINSIKFYKASNNFQDITLLKEFKRDSELHKPFNFFIHNNILYNAGGKSLFLLNEPNDIQKIDNINLASPNIEILNNYIYYIGQDALTGNQLYRYKLSTTPAIDITKNPIKIYPNPASNSIIVENLEGKFDYIITSLDGRVCKTGKFDQNTKTIDIKMLTSGMYVITFRNAFEKWSKSLVVSNNY